MIASASLARGDAVVTARALPSLLVGVVVLTAGCGGDDDSADASAGSAVVDTTLVDTTLVETRSNDDGDGATADTETESGAGASTGDTGSDAGTDASTVSSSGGDPGSTSSAGESDGSDTSTDATVASTHGTAAADASTAPGGDADTVTWTDPDGLFTVDFPAEPTTTQIPVPDAGNGATLTAYIYEDADGAFLANRTDSTDIDATVTDVSLRDAVTGSMSFIGGTIGRSDELTIQGRDAIRFDFVVAGGVGEGLTIGDGVIVYQLLALGEESSHDDFVAFVDSFTFTEDQS